MMMSMNVSIPSALTAGAAVLALTVGSAGAVTRPDFQNLGRCAPDVVHIDHNYVQVLPLPLGCASQTWTLGVYDLRPGNGAYYPNQVGVVTAYDPAAGVDVHAAVEGFCGVQLDLFVNGQLYAAQLDEVNGCTDISTPTTTSSTTTTPSTTVPPTVPTTISAPERPAVTTTAQPAVELGLAEAVTKRRSELPDTGTNTVLVGWGAALAAAGYALVRASRRLV